MVVRLNSIASGLPPNLVEQLIQVERIPIQKIEQKKDFVNSKLSLVNDLKGKVGKISDALLGLGNTKSFRDLLAVSSDPNILDATVDKNVAEPGMYRFEIKELAERSSAMSNGFPDKNSSQVGVGFFNIVMPDGKEKSIYIDSSHNTLSGMADLINENAKELGVRARVINDGSGSGEPWRLAVVGSQYGHDGKVEFPTFYFLDGDQEFYFDRVENARTAKIKFDGFEIEADENTLKDLIPGVTIDLKKAQPGQIVTLKIKEDVEKITGKIKDFVDRVNDVLKFINDQNKLDENSDTRMTLGGDSLLTILEGRLRSALFSLVPGRNEEDQTLRLSDMGIQFQKDGSIRLIEDKFENLLQKDFEQVAHVFIGDRVSYGVVPQMMGVIRSANDRGSGFLENRSMTLQSQISRYDKEIADKERRVERKAESIRQKFAQLETAMANLKGQGNALGALASAGQGSGISLQGATIS